MHSGSQERWWNLNQQVKGPVSLALLAGDTHQSWKSLKAACAAGHHALEM